MPPLLQHWDDPLPKYPGKLILAGLFVHQCRFDVEGFCKFVDVDKFTAGNYPRADSSLMAGNPDAQNSLALVATTHPTNQTLATDNLLALGLAYQPDVSLLRADNSLAVATTNPTNQVTPPCNQSACPTFNSTPASPFEFSDLAFNDACSQLEIPSGLSQSNTSTSMSTKSVVYNGTVNIFNGANAVQNTSSVPSPLKSGQAGIATLDVSILARFMQDINGIPAALALARDYELVTELKRVRVLKE